MHFVEQSRKQSSGYKSGDKAGGEPQSRQPHSLPEHKRQHVRAARAERHADTNLASALRDQIREHAIDAYCGEQQRQARKKTYEQGAELLGHIRISRKNFLNRLSIVE